MDDDSELIKDSVKDVEKWKNRRRLRRRENKEDEENETVVIPTAPMKQKSVDKKPSSPPSSPPPSKQPIGKRLQQRVSDVPEDITPPPAKDTFIKGSISVQSKKDKSKLGAQKKTATLRKSPGTSGFGFTLEDCPDQQGLQIKDVDPESPAGVADLKKGDLLLEINNADVRSMNLANTEKLIRDCLRMGHITMVLLSPGDSKPVKVPGRLKAAAAQFEAISQNGIEAVKDSKTVLSKQVEKVEENASDTDNVSNKSSSKMKKSTEAEKRSEVKSESTSKEKKSAVSESPRKTESTKPLNVVNGQVNRVDKAERDKSAPPIRKDPKTSKVADTRAEKSPVIAEHKPDIKSSMPVEASPKSKVVGEPMPLSTDSVGSDTSKSATNQPIKGSRVQSLKSAYEGAISKETREPPKVATQRPASESIPSLVKTQPKKENGARNVNIETMKPAQSPGIGFSAIHQAVSESSSSVDPVTHRSQVPNADRPHSIDSSANNKSEVVISFRGQPRENVLQQPPQGQSFPANQHAIFASQQNLPTFTTEAQQPTFASGAQQPMYATGAQHPTFATGAPQPTFASGPHQPTFAKGTQQPGLPEHPAPPYTTGTPDVYQQPISAFTAGANVQRQAFTSVGNAIRSTAFTSGSSVQQLAHPTGIRQAVAEIPDLNRPGQTRPPDNTASFSSQPIERNIPIELEKRPSGSELRPQEVSSEEPCVACWKPLGSGTAVRIESLKIHYHMACFRCCECGRPLEMNHNGIDVEVRANNRLYCDRCSLVCKGIRTGRY